MEHPIKRWQDCTQVSERASEAARPVRPHDQRGDWHDQGDYDHGDNRLKVEDVATCRSSTTNDFCLRSYDARAWTHNWERATTAWSWGMSGAPRISTSCTGTGWLATTFSFLSSKYGATEKDQETGQHQQDHPEELHSLTLSWILPDRKPRTKPLVAEKTSQNNDQ